MIQTVSIPNRDKREELVRQELNRIFEGIISRVQDILGAALQSDRQYANARKVVCEEVYRDFQGRIDVLMKTASVAAVGDDVFLAWNRIFSNTGGRIKTVLEAMLTAPQVNGAKDIAHKAVWRDVERVGANITRILMDLDVPQTEGRPTEDLTDINSR